MNRAASILKVKIMKIELTAEDIFMIALALNNMPKSCRFLPSYGTTIRKINNIHSAVKVNEGNSYITEID